MGKSTRQPDCLCFTYTLSQLHCHVVALTNVPSSLWICYVWTVDWMDARVRDAIMREVMTFGDDDVSHVEFLHAQQSFVL